MSILSEYIILSEQVFGEKNITSSSDDDLSY